MINPRETRTHAADSAPGVGDGPAGVKAPAVNSKPGGRRGVWIAVAIVCLIVLVAFFVKPLGIGSTVRAPGAPATAQPAQQGPGGTPSPR